jgi:hypothetical protein
MWHSRFFGTLLAVQALLGFMESQTVLAAYPTSSEFSTSQSQEIRGLDGSFQLAIMGGSAVPLDIPQVDILPEKSPEKIQPAKPAVEQPAVTQKEEPKKASKPKSKKVKKAKVKKAPAKKPVEDEGFLTKTFKQLVGSNDDKKVAASKSQLQKTAGKMPEPEKEKEEEGLLTKTLKSLMGGDKKKEQTAKTNPINTAPIGSATKKKVEDQPKTAKSETKKTLKDSFEKLIGVGAVKDEGDPKSAKTDKPAGKTKSAKTEESGGLMGGILGGSDKKKEPSATKQAKAEDAVQKTSAPAKPRKLTARKYVADDDGGEEGQSEGNYAGAEKGKNLLKESFKTLIAEDKKKEEEE